VLMCSCTPRRPNFHRRGRAVGGRVNRAIECVNKVLNVLTANLLSTYCSIVSVLGRLQHCFVCNSLIGP